MSRYINRLINTKAATALLATVLFCVSTVPVRGDYFYHVDVDTSSIQGSSGLVDFQFNPESSTAIYQTATATISGFTLDQGAMSNVTTRLGQVSGELPSTISFDNKSDLNVIYQSIKFGNGLHFDLTFSGDAVTHPTDQLSGTSFFLLLLDTNFNPLLTIDPSGIVLTVDVNPDGTTNVTSFPSTLSDAPVVTVSQQTSVPEPTSMIPYGIGMVTLAGYTWYHGKRLRKPAL